MRCSLFKGALAGALCAVPVYAQTSTTTPNVALQLPAFNTPNWQIPTNANWIKLDSMLGGQTPIPALNVSGNLIVGGAVIAPNLTFTNQQLVTAIGYTPLSPSRNLGDLTNPAQALATLGGLPAQVPAAWSSTAQYSLDQLAIGSDGITYISLANANQGNDPTSAGSTYWGKFAGNPTLGFTPLNPGSNLSDVANGPQALANLGGLPAQVPAVWSATATYTEYALVIGSDGTTYISTANNNVNNNPTSAGSGYWSKFAGGGSGGAANPAGTVATRQQGQVNANGVFGADSSFGLVSSANAKAGLAQLEAAETAFKGPKVNVLNSDFAGGADPKNSTDSTAAFQAAINYAVSQKGTGRNGFVIYVPAGNYTISSPLQMSGTGYSLSLVGDGNGETTINYTATSGQAAFTWGGTAPPNGGHVGIRDITIKGIGHQSSANLVDINGVSNFDFMNVQLSNCGGTALLLAAERFHSFGTEFYANRRSIQMNLNANEDYFYDTHFMYPGIDTGNYSYNVNAVNGVEPTSGVFYPDYHTQVTVFQTQNDHFINGSCKPEDQEGCFWFNGGTQNYVSGMYFEGFNRPAINPAVQSVGYNWLGTSQSAITTAAGQSFTVPQGIWSPFLGDGSATAPSELMEIFPPDFVNGDMTDASSLGNGIYKGTVEYVYDTTTNAQPNGTATVTLTSRGSNSTTPIAWPAGAVISMLSSTNNLVLDENHFDEILGFGSGNLTDGSSNTALNSSWSETPARFTSDVIDGPVYDGYKNLTFSSGGSASTTSTIAENNNEWFSGPNDNEGATGIPLTGVLFKRDNCTWNLETPTPKTWSTPAANTPSTSIPFVFTTGWASNCQVVIGSGYADGSNAYATYINPDMDLYDDTKWNVFHYNSWGGSGSNYGTSYTTFHDQIQFRDDPASLYFNMNGSAYGTPSFHFGFGSTDALTVNAAAITATAPVIANGTLTANAGIVNAITPYNTATAFTMPAGSQFVQQGAAGTVTLPTMLKGQMFVVENTQPNGAVTFTAPTGSISVNGVSLGSTYSTYSQGTFIFEADGSNYQLLLRGASDPAFPAMPTYATKYENEQSPPSGLTWVACSGPPAGCGGGSTGTSTITTGVAAPSLSGAAVELDSTPTAPPTWASGTTYAQNNATTTAIVNYNGNNWASLQAANTGNTPAAGSAWWQAVGGYNDQAYLHITPCPITGNCGAISQMQWHVSVYFPATNSNVQAYEFDPDVYSGGWEYQASFQCDVGGSGTWRPWNNSGNVWVTTRFPCTIASKTGSWHTLSGTFAINTILHTYTYQSFRVDGVDVFTNLGLTYSGAQCGTVGVGCNGSPEDYNLQFQMDNMYALSGTNKMDVDNIGMGVY